MRWGKLERRSLLKWVAALSVILPATKSANATSTPSATVLGQVRGAAPLPGKASTLGQHQPKLLFTRLFTTDVDRTDAFYTKAIGMKRVSIYAPANSATSEVMYSFDEDPATTQLICLNNPDRAEPIYPANIVLLVTDIEGIAARIPQFGGKVKRPPSGANAASPFINLAASDPDGHDLEIVQLKKT